MCRREWEEGLEAATLHNMGGVYAALGEKGKALEFYEQAMPLTRKVGDVFVENITLFNKANAELSLGRAEDGLTHWEQAASLGCRVRMPSCVDNVLV